MKEKRIYYTRRLINNYDYATKTSRMGGFFEPPIVTQSINFEMMARTLIKFLIAGIILTLLPACVQSKPEIVYNTVLVYLTATPGSQKTPKPTHTNTILPTNITIPTQTTLPSITPTPTSTAYPISVSGDPRELRVQEPIPQSGAPCGFVDLFDFPIDPPDGGNASGGQGFGVYRYSYDKYHSGEDWGIRNRLNFGIPVYSVGHGIVTYSQPNGWGEDKGVVILQHTLTDGQNILSFYGHLDPPSVVLNVGECVKRGEPVGKIGRPRTPPHLHFEMRTHMPIQPGPGYWSVDPTLAGWVSPSAFIWEHRIGTSPGVLWTLPASSLPTKALNLFDNTLVAIRDWHVVGINTDDGSISWNVPISETVTNSIYVANPIVNQTSIPTQNSGNIYFHNLYGQISAFSLSDSNNGEDINTAVYNVSPQWEVNSEVYGRPIMMPLSNGGLILAGSQRMIALSSAGEELWRLDAIPPIMDWVLWDNDLIFTTSGRNGSVWVTSDTGPIQWEGQMSGYLTASNDRIFLYSVNGVYQLNVESRSTELIHLLPTGYINYGDMISLPDRRLLIAHRDGYDKRLIVLNEDSTISWQRSYSSLHTGDAQLIALENTVCLVIIHDTQSSANIAIYTLDTISGELTHIFTGGTRSSQSGGTWISPAGGDRLLVSIGGGNTFLINTQDAKELFSH